MFWRIRNTDVLTILVLKNMFRPYEGKEFAMAKKKDTPVRLDQLTEEEKMKYEIADELGLLDRVMKDGWKSLSSKETGRIGGILARKRKNRSKK